MLSVLAAIIALALIAVGLYFSWRYWYRARLLADTPIARIRSARQGYVELCGQATLMAGEPIIAPLSLLPCVWYRCRMEHRSRNRWGVISREVSDHLFAIEDGTGRCVIDPDGAELVNARRHIWYTHEDGTRCFGIGGAGAAYRMIEHRIMPGEEIHVMGRFHSTGQVTDLLDTHREVSLLLEEWKKDPRRMALFDRRKNGRIDPDEWEAARRAAYRQVERQQLERSADPIIHMIGATGDRNRPFLIAALSERGLINRYRWYAVGWLTIAVLTAGLTGSFWNSVF